MHDFTPLRSLAGGLLIGIAASLLYAGTGRTAGISGIVGGLFSRSDGGRGWRVQFITGLLAGGVLLMLFAPSVFGAGTGRPLALVAVAGLLVGFGTRLGGGCTSGHGVCGLSRLSARSLIATVTFIAAGMLTVWLARRFGVGS
jgi:uncharacterized membrane protein YedE/YeeE